VIPDAGTYNLILVVTLDSYPVSYTHVSDSSASWTLTIIDPCVASTLTALSTLNAMSTSVMFGSAKVQAFTEPSDSISTTYDVTLNHYVLTALPSTYTGPVAGSNLCGARSFSINAPCNFLTVTFPANPNKPVLSVISSSPADVGTWSCIVTAGLSSYTQTVTKTFSVVINECDLATFTLDSSAA
jgi:hypothetical protein